MENEGEERERKTKARTYKEELAMRYILKEKEDE